MTTAILTAKSQNRTTPAESSGTVSTDLAKDCRKMQIGEAKAPSYLVVGFDSEWKNEGETNRLLSYHFFACDFKGASWSGIFYTQGKRFRLTTFLSAIIQDGMRVSKIEQWPNEIWMVAHFTLADLVMFSDFQKLRLYFDSIRRTFASVRDRTVCCLWDQNRHAHEVTLTLRDSMLLAPAGKQRLADLGALVGLGKIALDAGEIERMDKLLVNDRARFEEYAVRDAEIAVRYCIKMAQLNQQVTGRFEIPPTLSSMGVNLLLRLWKEFGIDKHGVLGTEIVTERDWSQRRRQAFKKQREVPTADRHAYESFATECYHGGRNEQYIFGAGAEGIWTDYDLSGAYTTAMSLIGLPDWKAIRQTRELNVVSACDC